MAEVTYKPVVYKNRQNPDGSFDVKIRVTFKRKSTYMSTTETALEEDLDANMEIKSPELLVKLYNLIIEFKKIVSTLDQFVVDTMEVGEIVDFIKKTKASSVENFRLSFVEFANKHITTKRAGSARNYRTALNSFIAFMGNDQFDISVITSSLMRRYEAHLGKTIGKDSRTLTQYTTYIGAIHRAARLEYNDNELGQIRIRNPFEFYSPPRQKAVKHRALTVESIQKLIDIKDTLPPRLQRFVDMCLLSFCLMGTNLPDLWTATKKDDIIYYNRTKTRIRRSDGAEMQIRLEPICRCIWEKYLDDERAFNMYRKYKWMNSIVYLADDKEKRQQLAKDIGFDGALTMYCFRHAWATIAYSIGVEKTTINDCLCHVDPAMSVTDIYIKKDWSVLWEANKKVLEQFTWK